MPEMGEILIVEDDHAVRRLLSHLFPPYYSVHAAGDGLQAVRILSEHDDIDVVTLDVAMPGVQGNDLLPCIRQISPAAEVIMLTGTATLHTAINAMRWGANEFIMKPFDTVSVLMAMRRAMGKKRAIDGYAQMLRNLGDDVQPDLIEFVEGRGWRGLPADAS